MTGVNDQSTMTSVGKAAVLTPQQVRELLGLHLGPEPHGIAGDGAGAGRVAHLYGDILTEGLQVRVAALHIEDSVVAG